MIHRYGRHGNKAWLRWRKKRLRRTSLIPTPQIVVLNVPLDFLRRIRKVTILMEDGQNVDVNITTGQLPAPTVDSTLEKRSAVLTEGVERARANIFDLAKIIAIKQASKAFDTKINPYQTIPNQAEASGILMATFYSGVGLSTITGWSFNEAEESFLDRLQTEYSNAIGDISSKKGANTQALQDLLVSARKDNVEDNGEPPSYAEHRKTIQAYRSLLAGGVNDSKEIYESIQERAALYRKFYDEFKPKKEED